MRKEKKESNDEELNNEELEELESYLQNNFFYDIYEKFTSEYDSHRYSCFTPLNFFRLFSEQIAFIKENKSKPLFVARKLVSLPLDSNQFNCFYDSILDYFDEERNVDEKINVCCREIEKLHKKFFTYVEIIDPPPNPFDFDETLKHLKTLPKNEEKIVYLIKIKTYFEQFHESESGMDYPNFVRNCNLEIEKLKELMNLEESQNTSKDGIKKHKDLTLDRAVLAMSYLLDELKVKCPLSKKKEFIDFITPFSPNTIKTKLENLHEKQDKNFVEYEKDLETINKHFENLGLVKIVKQIKEDLEFE